MATQDIKIAYETAKNDIANLLGFFECELGKERTVIQWGWVGTLNHVRQNLIETLSFMSGFSEEEIKETLEETRMDAEAQADIETERKNQGQ
jgi:hypothetical protein